MKEPKTRSGIAFATGLKKKKMSCASLAQSIEANAEHVRKWRSPGIPIPETYLAQVVEILEMKEWELQGELPPGNIMDILKTVVACDDTNITFNELVWLAETARTLDTPLTPKLASAFLEAIRQSPATE